MVSTGFCGCPWANTAGTVARILANLINFGGGLFGLAARLQLKIKHSLNIVLADRRPLLHFVFVGFLRSGHHENRHPYRDGRDLGQGSKPYLLGQELYTARSCHSWLCGGKPTRIGALAGVNAVYLGKRQSLG